MDFFKFIQSLDELLFEMVSWLLFYPLTLWRIIRAPLKTMASAERELHEVEKRQFDDTIPPPLFLALTLIIINIVELVLLGRSHLAIVNPRLSETIGSDVNLIIFRTLVVSLLPLTAAVRLARARGIHLDRPAIKAPFYAQCYAAALFAILLALAVAASGKGFLPTSAGFLAVTAFAFAWLFLIEGFWFSARLKESFAYGLWQAAILMAEWAVLVAGTLFLITRR